MNSQQWTSKLGFVLAAAGSAIGLGAIWKFPYMAGIERGGAFFLIFIGFTLLIGLPLLLAEFVIGRSTQKRPLMRIEKSHQNTMAMVREIRDCNMFHITFFLQCCRRLDFIILMECNYR